MGKYKISLAAGRKNDLRFKLSEAQIKALKKRTERSAILAQEYGVSRSTIDYYRRDDYRAKVMARNAKHRPKWTPRHNELKQRRRDLVRPLVREYTRLQMRNFRSKTLH